MTQTPLELWGSAPWVLAACVAVHIQSELELAQHLYPKAHTHTDNIPFTPNGQGGYSIKFV